MTPSTAGSLARALGVPLEGDAERAVKGVASLSRATVEELAFCVGGRWRDSLAATAAGTLILPLGLPAPPQATVLRAGHPRLVFARAAAMLHPRPWPAPGVHPTAVVAASAAVAEGATVEAYAVIAERATVGAGAWIQSFVYVGADVVVGRGCRLMPGAVVLDGARLGDEVQLHPGAVIGADGFGHVDGPEGSARMPHLASVVVEPRVEIGANTCVDRGALDDTRVGAGTRIDNLVQVAHGVQVGADCRLAAFVGLAGGAVLEDGVVMGGRSAVVDGVRVGRGAAFAGLASASRDVAPGARLGGSPARPHRRWLREVAALQQLPDLLREVESLKQRIADLEGSE